MCELTHGMAEERHGNGIGVAWARHAMCESAFSEKFLEDNAGNLGCVRLQ